MDKLDSVIGEDETVFCIRRQGESVEVFIQAENEDEISEMLAVLIDRSLENHPDEGSRRAGNILLDAVDIAVESRILNICDGSNFPILTRKKGDISVN